MVDDAVIVEIKAVAALIPSYERQLLTYLRLLGMRVGLLLNFGSPCMGDGIRRVVNQLE